MSAEIYPNPGEPGYEEALLAMVIKVVQECGYRPEIPDEIKVLVREVQRLRRRVAELEGERQDGTGWNE